LLLKQQLQQCPGVAAAAGGGNLTHCSSSQEAWLNIALSGRVLVARGGGAAAAAGERSGSSQKLYGGSMGGQAMHVWQRLCALCGEILFSRSPGACDVQNKGLVQMPVLLAVMFWQAWRKCCGSATWSDVTAENR